MASEIQKCIPAHILLLITVAYSSTMCCGMHLDVLRHWVSCVANAPAFDEQSAEKCKRHHLHPGQLVDAMHLEWNNGH